MGVGGWQMGGGRMGGGWGGGAFGSECWMFYGLPTSRVIFTVKTSLDLFRLR